jgi:hypothetical protein
MHCEPVEQVYVNFPTHPTVADKELTPAAQASNARHVQNE